MAEWTGERFGGVSLVETGLRGREAYGHQAITPNRPVTSERRKPRLHRLTPHKLPTIEPGPALIGRFRLLTPVRIDGSWLEYMRGECQP